jgi:hypothetical protein
VSLFAIGAHQPWACSTEILPSGGLPPLMGPGHQHHRHHQHHQRNKQIATTTGDTSTHILSINVAAAFPLIAVVHRLAKLVKILLKWFSFIILQCNACDMPVTLYCRGVWIYVVHFHHNWLSSPLPPSQFSLWLAEVSLFTPGQTGDNWWYIKYIIHHFLINYHIYISFRKII